jgi:predicted acyl esterase
LWRLLQRLSRAASAKGGAFELKQVTWAYSQGLESPELQKDPLRLAAVKAVDMKAWFASMPWKRGHTPISLIPDYEAYVYEQWEHGVFDDFWKQPGIYAAGYYDTFAKADMVHMSGWYDPIRARRPRTISAWPRQGGRCG